MTKCIECNEQYEPQGGILISICPACKALSKFVRDEIGDCPETYTKRAGILVPNPAYDEWLRRDAEIRASHQ